MGLGLKHQSYTFAGCFDNGEEERLVDQDKLLNLPGAANPWDATVKKESRGKNSKSKKIQKYPKGFHKADKNMRFKVSK